MAELSVGRGPFRKIEGKRYPVVAEVVVRLTNDLEQFDVNGNRFVHPVREERLQVSIEKDGKRVGVGTVVLADVLRRLAHPECEEAPIDEDPDEIAFQQELAEYAGQG